MAKILLIEAYLGLEHGKNSLLLYAQNQFIQEYQQLHPTDEIIKLDLNQEEKLKTILDTNNITSFWTQKSLDYVNLITSVDKLIISTNMINFTVSPTLRNFLDNILIPDKTFTYDIHGKHSGLLNNQIKAQLIMVQGDKSNAYPFANFDSWLKNVLHFMGIKQIQTLLFSGTNTRKQANLSLEEKFKLKIKEFKRQVSEF